jgi:histone H3/H4
MAKKTGKVEPLFVKSKVREYIKGNECNTSSGVLDGESFNGIIMELLDAAIARAKANNRKTVKARDL